MISSAKIERFETDLTAEEFTDVAEFLRAERNRKAPEVKAEPKPKPEEPKVKTEDVETFVPWDFRFNTWLLNNFGLGSRDGVYTARGDQLWLPRKLLVWGILAWPRLRRMLWAVRSGKATEDVYLERWKACNDCPNLKTDKKGLSRCGSCGCPDWHYSDLVVKNGLRANHCPERRHPGDYIQLVTHKWPNRKKVKQKPVRSVGCGGGHG